MTEFKVTPDEIVPERIHLYPAEKMLAPRGSMEKESVSLELSRRLGFVWRSWTNPTYTDSLSKKDTAAQLMANFHEEVYAAFREFVRQVEATTDDLPEDFAQNCLDAFLDPEFDTKRR